MQPFHFPIKIYIEDTDYGGIVYHSNYLKFFERARSEWLEALGLDLDWQKAEQVYFVVRAVTIDFLHPARLSDKLNIISTIKGFTRTSIIFSQQLRNPATTDTILSSAEVKMVCLDQTFRPRAIPRQLHIHLTGEQA